VRARGGTVVPLCSFVRSWIDRHEGYEELVDQPLLAKLRP
jgi:predicted GNAT family acetyltransferase